MNKDYAYYAVYAILGPAAENVLQNVLQKCSTKCSTKMFHKNVPRGTIGVEQWNVDNFVDNVDNFAL